MTVLCGCCDKPATVIFRATRFRADDLHLQCDVCLDTVCENCAEVDSEGRCECVMCMQTAAMQAKERTS